LIVLERLEGLKKKHGKILQELLMDILRALSSPSPDICKKVLEVAMDVVTARNVQEVVNVLKREVQKTMSDDQNEGKGSQYRNMLIRAIHGCAVRFPQVAESVVHTLMDFLSTDSGMQVIIFVRAIVEQYPVLRAPLLNKLLSSLDDVSSNQVLCVCLWILGEYSETADAIVEAFDTIVGQTGEAPFVLDSKEKEDLSKAPVNEGPKIITKNVVLADGTYATQSIYSEAPKKSSTLLDKMPALRRMLIEGDIFLGEILASSLTKLCLRLEDMPEVDAAAFKKMTATSVLLMCGIVKMAEVTVAAQRSSLSDCQERITLDIRALLDPKAKGLLKPILLTSGRERFSQFLKTLKEKELKESKSKQAENEITTHADDLIHFRQLKSLAVQGGDVDLDDGSDLARATGYDSADALLSSELNHVYQLSGFADPVYAEAFVTVHDYDIVLEILVINRTPNTLANLTVELSTMGDMKIVERPQANTIAPNDQITIRASIKVSSTETGHIFGTIVYEDTQTREKCYINLNDIHMDIMDYIRPATCTDEVFRSMWAEFEWENKVAISTSITSLVEFLEHVVSSTNMRCLTPHDKNEKGSFLAANLYARRYVV
jgi:coatomer subunit beta